MSPVSIEKLLQKEIATVVGCTEPAPIAYAVQCAKRYLKRPFDPDAVKVVRRLSPEMLRNASTAVVPIFNRKGIKAAVTAGLLSSSTDLNLFASLKVPRAHPLLTRRLWLSVVPSRKHGIYIRAVLITPGETVTVTVKGRHDSITAITRNGGSVYRKSRQRIPRLKGLKEITAIVNRRTTRLESIAGDFIMDQVKGDPGNPLSDSVAGLITKRMSGRPLPVVTITGSGNQGIFLGVPLCALYRKLGRRALPAVLFSLLTQIYLSQIRQRISDKCGLATKSAPSLAAGLAYAQGENIPAITRSMTTVYERLKKMPCHGAKSSCGVKASHALRCVLSAASDPVGARKSNAGLSRLE
ncbi:MAG: L-serine ammonia-lyase, iron-sulfur-dependent, subunit alpha [Chlamydiota bacterium]